MRGPTPFYVTNVSLIESSQHGVWEVGGTLLPSKRLLSHMVDSIDVGLRAAVRDTGAVIDWEQHTPVQRAGRGGTLGPSYTSLVVNWMELKVRCKSSKMLSS